MIQYIGHPTHWHENSIALPKLAAEIRGKEKQRDGGGGEERERAGRRRKRR